MSKKMLFISHAQVDTLFAREIKSIIDAHFMGAFEIFVSSEDTSIRYGDTWATKIFEALDKTTCMLSLCSPVSIARPWIPFEMGYVEGRGATCIPICIRGLTIESLPMPLSLKQSTVLDNLDNFNSLLKRLSQIFNLKEKKLAKGKFKKYEDLTLYTPELVTSKDEYEVIQSIIKWSFKNTLDAWQACFQALDGQQFEMTPENVFYSFEISLNMGCIDFKKGIVHDRFHVFCLEFKYFVESCKIAITIADDARLKKIFSSFLVIYDYILKNSTFIELFQREYAGKLKDPSSQKRILDFFYKVRNKEIERHANVHTGFIIINDALDFFKNASGELQTLFSENNIKLDMF